MAAPTAGSAPTEDYLSPSFLCFSMPDAFNAEVVKQALDARPQVSAAARNRLQQIVNSACTVNGYRRAGLAPTPLLLEQVSEGVQFRNDLAGAVLQVWMECNEETLAQVLHQLDNLEIPTLESAPSDHSIRFRAADGWWHDAGERFLESYCDGDEDKRDEGILLFALATGFLQIDADDAGDTPLGQSTVQQVLSAAYNALYRMAADDPGWEDAVPDFIASLSELQEIKLQERNRAENLDKQLSDLRDKHRELLAFFQWDARQWTADNVPIVEHLEAAQTLAADLDALLTRYAAVHERAATAAEELERSRQRAELLPEILETGGKLDALFEPEDDGEETREPASLPDAGPKVDAAANSIPDPVGDNDAPAAPQPETPPVPASDETAQSAPEGFAEIPPCDIEERLLLRLEVAELQQENDDLEREVKSLETALFESRSKEEGYWYAQASQDGQDASAMPEISDVTAAVELARQRFDGQLIFRLNSDSSVEGNQFKWPGKIWNALEWLATTYYDARTGKTQNTDLDASCRQASDMWYKTSQHETTMTSYRNSYTTKVDGRTIWLQEHIGKGTSFDPRRTIRIAFDWDRDLRKVVIGYIGQHQRTAST